MNQRLMRTWYQTDVDEEKDSQYKGAFSMPFPMEGTDRRIVAVDWSEKGWVEVTWLILSP